MRKLCLTLLLAAAAPWVQASGLTALEAFMQNAQAGRADFTQEVTAPPKDGQAARTKKSSGQFEFQRPGKFKFAYTKPFAQTIVADGKTLWLYDVDLNQITQRAQAQALGSTPAAILASAANLKALQADFDLSALPDEGGLQWVQAKPKTRDGQLQSVRVGFAGEQLAALEILDSFGQRSMLRFTQMQTSASLPAATFQFVPPAGADVLKQ